MTEQPPTATRDWGALWEQFLADCPWHFMFLGSLIGSLTFMYLFVPTPGGNWREVWFSTGVMWAMLWWLTALICVSCGVRGLGLRLRRWRQRKAEVEAACVADVQRSDVEQAGTTP
jgi:hypothetical protein